MGGEKGSLKNGGFQRVRSGHVFDRRDQAKNGLTVVGKMGSPQPYLLYSSENIPLLAVMRSALLHLLSKTMISIGKREEKQSPVSIYGSLRGFDEVYFGRHGRN